MKRLSCLPDDIESYNCIASMYTIITPVLHFVKRKMKKTGIGLVMKIVGERRSSVYILLPQLTPIEHIYLTKKTMQSM